MHAMLMGRPCVNMSGDSSSKHEYRGTACSELHVSEWAKHGLQAHRSGKSMQYRVTTPNSQAGRRYAFQFHVSSEADWKQRRKESSTMAEAASVNKLLMSSKSALQVSLFCNTMALDKDTSSLGLER